VLLEMNFIVGTQIDSGIGGQRFRARSGVRANSGLHPGSHYASSPSTLDPVDLTHP
jgi:hypothetical protein